VDPSNRRRWLTEVADFDSFAARVIKFRRLLEAVSSLSSRVKSVLVSHFDGEAQQCKMVSLPVWWSWRRRSERCRNGELANAMELGERWFSHPEYKVPAK